jgi:Ca2+-binding RTX toxin-like protein
LTLYNATGGYIASGFGADLATFSYVAAQSGTYYLEASELGDDGIGSYTVKVSSNLNGTDGNDRLIGTIDNETLNGWGGNDVLDGRAGNDILNGGLGNDVLNGSVGADRMAGGDGSDTYYVDNIGDVVSESNATASTGGTDTVYSYLATYTLGANVENGRILASGVANLTGNGLNNVLYAGAGNNVLNGGTGTDTVSYGYAGGGVTVSLALATAQATGGSGSDTLIGIENLTGSAYADRLTGNSGANVLTGGAGNDVLNGGVGADRMVGGDGSDIYYVDNIGDVVSETNATASTGGTDTVYSYLATYTLGANVENGRILATGVANLAGNGLTNALYAGAGNNVLNGGTGTDTVSYAYAGGGVTVSLALATVQATGGSGSDTLIGIENLTGSAYADRLTGNSGANVLNGGAGNDILNGYTGNDILTGGTGLDIFRFDTALNATTNLERITDFSVADDTIQLENAIFTKLTGVGTLSAANFRASTAGTAADANDFMLYDTDSGALFYDADGTGVGGAVQLVIIGTGLALTAADFVVT